jgi:hypothetical protein
VHEVDDDHPSGEHGRLGFTAYGSCFLYVQLAPVADCGRVPGLPAGERALRPNPRHRLNRNSYRWSRRSPIHQPPLSADGVIHNFNTCVIRAQPLAYGRWSPATWSTTSSLAATRAGTTTARPRGSSERFHPLVLSGLSSADPAGARAPPAPQRPEPVHRRDGGRPAHRHRRVAVPARLPDPPLLSGQVLPPCLLSVLAAVVLRRGSRRLSLDAAMLAAAALTLLVVASALSLLDYRYQLGAVVLLPAAAAMAATTLRRA